MPSFCNPPLEEGGFGGRMFFHYQ